MARIDGELLNKLMRKLDVTRSRVYALVQESVRRTNLPANLAAVVLARDAGISISRFASDDDLALIRGVESSRPTQLTAVDAGSAQAKPVRSVVKGNRRRLIKEIRKGNRVWVVYGRNEPIRKALFSFLQSIGLRPIEWNSAIATSKKGSPYIGQVLDAGFDKAIATIVLFTPDDEAKLRDQFIKRTDPRLERKLTGQPRPNVLFEAGMAFGLHPEKTVIVQVGKIRPISDLTGRHITHLTNSFESRHQLAVKLRAIGCPVDDTGDDWHTAGQFN